MPKKRSIEKFFPNNTIEELLTASNKLSEKEKEIFELYYGLNGKQEQTTEVIAKQYGYAKCTLQNVVIPRIKKKLKGILEDSYNLKISHENIHKAIQEIEKQIYNNTLDENNLSYKVGNETIYVDIVDTKCSLAYKSSKTGLLDRIHAQEKKCLVYKIYLSKPNENIQDKYVIKDKKTNKCYKYVYMYEDGNYDLTGVLNELVCFKMENIKIYTLPSLNNNYDAQKTQEYIKRKKLSEQKAEEYIKRKKLSEQKAEEYIKREKISEQTEEEKQYQINLEDAIALIKIKNYSEAIEKLESSLKSTNPVTLNSINQCLGKAYLKESKEILALKYYQESLKYNTKDYYSYLGICQSLTAMGNYDDALTYFQKCEDLQTSHLAHYFAIAEYYKQKQEYSHVLEQLDKVLKKYGNNYRAYYEKAQILVKIGQYEKAEEAVNQAIKYQGNNNNNYSLVLLGKIYYLTNRQEQAFQIFDNIVATNHSRSDLYEIGGFFHELELKDLAYKYYLQDDKFYCKSKISNAEVENHIKKHMVYNNEKMHSLFNCSINLATLEELINDSDKVGIQNGADIYQFKCSNIGTLYVDENDKRTVHYLTIFTLPFTKKIITAYPDYKLLTNQELQEISVDQINKIYERSLEPKIEYPSKLWEIEEKMAQDVDYAVKLFNQRDFNAAEKILQKCLISQSVQTFGKVNYYLGLIYTKQKKYLTAIKYFQDSLKLKKTYGILCNLGYAYMMEENYEEAIKCFKECDSFDVSRDWHLINLGICYKKEQNFEEALATFDKIISQSPNNWLIYYNKALLFYELQKYDDALNEISIIQKIWSKELATKTLLGKIYYMTNKETEALSLFEEIVQNNLKHNKNYNIVAIGNFFHELGLRELTYKYYLKDSNFGIRMHLSPEEVNAHFQEHFSVPKNPAMHSIFNTKISLELLNYLIKDENKVAIQSYYDVYQIKCPNIGKLYITKDDIENEDYITILTAPFSKNILLAYSDHKVYSDVTIPTYTLEQIEKLSAQFPEKITEPIKESEDKEIYERVLVDNNETINLINQIPTADEVEMESYRQQIKRFINVLPDPQEQTVLLLRLGYIQNKYFSLKEISQFFNMEQTEVNNIFNSALKNVEDMAKTSLNGVMRVKSLLNPNS